NTGSISGGWDYVGGISGSSQCDTSNCYNKGDVKGSNNNTGGLLGSNNGNVINCFNIGRVEGKSIVGGLVGYNYHDAGEYIFNCFKTGEVIGTGNNIGELCGVNNSSGTITRCFLNTDQSSGNIIGNFGGTYTNVMILPIDAFNSGEVAYMLSQGSMVIGKTTYDGSVWGQQLGIDNYPVPGSEYKLIAASKGNNNTYWSTFSNLDNDVTLSVPSNRTVEVYNATVSSGKMTLRKRSDNQVAKEEGVLLKSDNVYVNFKANETDGLTKEDYANNNLVATPAEAQTITADEGYTLYRLTYNNVTDKTGLGFYLGGATVGGTKYTNGKYLKATPGKAYLKVETSVSGSAPMRGFVIGEDDNTTGIDEITINGIDVNTGKYNEGVYDLQGRNVIKPAKGIYIKNGKKVIIK
ncbi:MAG: hypothetical protein ACI4RF_02775, partial [Eubacterium sp.]